MLAKPLFFVSPNPLPPISQLTTHPSLQTSYTLTKLSKPCQVSATFRGYNAQIYLAVGFNVETVTYKNLKFQVWDLGGQQGLRPYWRCYYQDTNAVIFVVDSTDKERLEYSKQELDIMLQEEELKGAPVLVLANK